MKYLDDNYGVGGSFYIGYYENGLVGQAINKGYDFATIPSCRQCNNDYRYWSSWSNYCKIQPFEVQASDLAGIDPYDPTDPQPAKLWDITRNLYFLVKNYGLNLDLTLKCDVTDFLCREKSLFADCLAKQVAVDILNLIAYSTRNNVLAKQTRDLAIFELGNKENNTPGAAKRLEMSLKALSFDLSDLNEACLPLNMERGANWTTI